MDQTTIKSTPKDFFTYLLATITLYICVYDILQLCFQYIDSITAVANTGFVSDFSTKFSIKWHLASLIVAFPIYLYTNHMIIKSCRLDSAKCDLRIRKWLIYFTLFLSVIIMMISLTSIIYDFLQNDLAITSIIKTLLVLLIIGWVFIYYNHELKQGWSNTQLKIITVLTIIFVLFIIIYGIFVTRPYHIGKQVSTSDPSILFDGKMINIPYCQNKGLKVTQAEDPIIQKTVNNFANNMGCNVGNNCMEKWNDHGTTKFSIAWQRVCGPIINGVPQVGDGGHGSTFVCSNQNGSTCCWPLGFTGYTVCTR
jgi:hypothetical protein